jgi:hypothetical protein
MGQRWATDWPSVQGIIGRSQTKSEGKRAVPKPGATECCEQIQLRGEVCAAMHF